MDFIFPFKRSLMAICLLAVVVGAHEYHINTTKHPAVAKEEAESILNKSKVLYSSSNSIPINPTSFGGKSQHLPLPFNRRLARSIVKRTEPSSTCNAINYYSNSQSGRRSTCPFDWVVNYENRRIPDRIIEQVCRNCGSCGHNHQCAQLRVQYQVYFRDTEEYSQQVVRAGCVCMSHDIGFTANVISPYVKVAEEDALNSDLFN